jgi:hypothetical protein
MWGAFLPFVAGAAALWFGLQRYRWHLRLWTDAAAACGLQVEGSFSSFWGLPLMLKAREGSLKVRLKSNGQRWRGTRVVVEVPEPKRFSEVRMTRREHGQARFGRQIEAGDEAFDKTFFIEGPMQLVHALLDPEVRRLLIRVNAESPLEIAGGELRAEVRDERVPEILSLLLAVGRRITRIQHVAQRVVAENARGDPEVGVRLQNLLFLVGEHPRKRRTVEALRTACADPSPQIRLRAAQELGAEGQDVLIELADSAVDDTWSAQAVSILGRRLPFDRVNAILTRGLCGHRILTARACLESLGRSGNPAAVDILAKVLASEEGELAAAAALALGETGSTAAEPPLILALQHEDTDVLVAAANALGQVGTAAAVLPLKEVERNSHQPVAAWPQLRRAARQAIAAIQTRLPGASPGQLSLAGSEAGQLSFATAEAGQLTLATDQAGQLSLPSQEAGQPL